MKMNLAARIESHLPRNRYHLLRQIAEEATARGLTCFAVGGFARDLLLDRLIHDLDLVFESDAIAFARTLAGIHGGEVTAHPPFHTAIWHLPKSYTGESQPGFIDFITARRETYASPGALPSVIPSTIDDDLRRRDLTINAMAVRLDGDHYGEMIDPLNGREDLAKGVIKILHPRSFVDDPTRIFRAIRYEQRYGFRMDTLTKDSINAESLQVLSALSGERLRHEMDLMMKEENRVEMFTQLQNLGIAEAIHPALAKAEAGYLGQLTGIPAGFDADLSPIEYALWLFDLSIDEIEAIAVRLRFHADVHHVAASAVRLKAMLSSLKASKPSEWTVFLDEFPGYAVLVVSLMDKKIELTRYLGEWRYVKPRTTGDELKQRGLPPGPNYKQILGQLRAAWLDGTVKTIDEETKLLDKIIA